VIVSAGLTPGFAETAEGFLTITGRKKDLIITAAGKNVAPAVLEERLRSHWLVGECLVVGDAKPYISAFPGAACGKGRPPLPQPIEQSLARWHPGPRT